MTDQPTNDYQPEPGQPAPVEQPTPGQPAPQQPAAAQPVEPNYVYVQPPQTPMYPGAKPTRYKKERIAAAILALSPLGGFGAHKFYNGYTTEAVLMIVISIVGACLVVGPLVAWVISIVEGISYLLKTDEEWERIYVYGKKGWF